MMCIGVAHEILEIDAVGLQQFVDQKKFRVLVSLMLVLIGFRLILSIWF